MRIRSYIVAPLALSVILAGTSASLADRRRGSDDSSPRQEDRREDRRNDSSSSSSSNNSTTTKKAATQRVRLIGRVGSDNNGGVKTTVKYESRGDAKTTSNRRFDVEVHNLVPGATLNVSISGKVVASITANSFGVAKLELRPSPDDANERPIPGAFPRLKAGDVVTVGDAKVTLRSR